MRTLGSAVVSLALLLAPGLLWLYTLASCLLASTMWWLCFTSSGSLTCWLLLHLLLHTSYWPLALAYGAFMAWDWTTCQRWICHLCQAISQQQFAFKGWVP